MIAARIDGERVRGTVPGQVAVRHTVERREVQVLGGAARLYSLSGTRSSHLKRLDAADPWRLDAPLTSALPLSGSLGPPSMTKRISAARLWAVVRGRSTRTMLRHALVGHTRMGGAAVSVKAVSFSPDGTLLATATASDDYSARLWVTRYSKGGDVLRQNLMSRHFI